MFGKKRNMLLVVVLGLVFVLAGCSGGNAESPAASADNNQQDENNVSSETPSEEEQTPPEDEPEDPVDISILTITYQSELPEEDNEVGNKIEELTNTNLDITFVPNAAYEDKFNVTLSSGSLPQVMLATNPLNPIVINAVRAGAFWEIGPYLDEFPNLSKLNRDSIESAAIDGKVYALTRSRDVARSLIAVRKDWLDNLGLQEPETLDDMYNVLKAFTEDDPDGNGQDDTFGLVDSSGLGSLNMFSVYQGAPNGWGEQDGKVVPSFMTPEYKEALNFHKKLFDEKLLVQDFALLNKAQTFELWENESVGVIMGPDTDINTVIGKLPTLYPDTNKSAVPIPTLTGPNGDRSLGSSGYFGGFLFSKSEIESEDELREILGFFDKLSTPELVDIMGNGIEGTDWEVRDGAAYRFPERKPFRSIFISFDQLRVANESIGTPDVMEPYQEKIAEHVRNNEELAVLDVSRNLLSDTFTQNGPELNKIFNDAKTKYIMGTITEAEYEAEIQRWLESGGEQVINEFTEQYNSNNP